mmetsp:Transcript_19887/g.41850  ORF Transcript_19887/g.41850 Transcript_19887/m.41850 type:complete len:225 (+) Transcript_19887:223-897(+)
MLIEWAICDSIPHQRVGSLESRNKCTFLAQSLGAMLTLSHSHPVSSTLDIWKLGTSSTLQWWSASITAGRKPRHNATIFAHPRIYQLGIGKSRHSRRQKFLCQYLDNILIRQTHQSTSIVKVTRHNRSQRRFIHALVIGIQTPQLRQTFILELIQHEKCPAGSTQLLESREDIGRTARFDLPVKVEAATDNIDSLKAGSEAEFWVASQVWTGRNNRFHSLTSQC